MHVLVCQQVARDAATGEEVADMLTGITSDGTLMVFGSLDDAVEQLARPGIVAVVDLPNEEGWQAAREMPPMMKAKFLRLLMKHGGKNA